MGRVPYTVNCLALGYYKSATTGHMCGCESEREEDVNRNVNY